MRFPITSNIKPRKITGLGDLIAVVAEPIKQIIINHAPESISTAMANCNCSQRKETLNKMFPIK